MRQTDNQQPKVSDYEYGWVAGFFDGEGAVCLSIRTGAGKNGSPKLQPFCNISGTDNESLNALTVILDKAVIAHHVAWYQPKGYLKNGNAYKPAWALVMAGHKRVGRFLRWITPGLRTKQERAGVLLDYINLREAHTDPRTPINEAEWERALELRRLNMKGKAQPFIKAVRFNTERPGASSAQLAANGRKGAQARWGIRD